MPAIAHLASDKREQSTSTPISVTARIDYILRFSKQAILVLDDNPHVYSSIASQYLSTRVNTDNAAFISASDKINDIQMRCRLIEQLFASRLFDPEQSLAQSIFKLAKEQREENITIVIENAHALSLQITFELCQLAEMAKKASKILNVVLLGLPHTGEKIASNRTLFNNKLTIVSASTGQLISMDDGMFKVKSSLFSGKKIRIFSIIVSLLLIAGAGSIYALNQHENLSLSQLNFFNFSNKAITDPLENNGFQNDEMVQVTEIEQTETLVNSTNQASTLDIFQAISDEGSNEIAQPADIIQALSATYITEAITPQNKAVEVVASYQPSEPEGFSITPEYYLSKNEGYAIQIIGFSDQDAQQKFIEKYKNLQIYGYHRLLNKKAFTVITSRIFTDKTDARRLISSLPKDIRARGPWVKSVSAIKEEINTFLSSQ